MSEISNLAHRGFNFTKLLYTWFHFYYIFCWNKAPKPNISIPDSYRLFFSDLISLTSLIFIKNTKNKITFCTLYNNYAVNIVTKSFFSIFRHCLQHHLTLSIGVCGTEEGNQLHESTTFIRTQTWGEYIIITDPSPSSSSSLVTEPTNSLLQVLHALHGLSYVMVFVEKWNIKELATWLFLNHYRVLYCLKTGINASSEKVRGEGGKYFSVFN